MRNRIGLAAFATLLALSLVAGTARAGGGGEVTEFDVHVGDAFLFGLSIAPVDVAQASNGDTIEVIFTGRFDTEDGQAEGTGDFRHFDKSGNLVEFGTFKAKRLISFDDFGLAGFTVPFPPTSHGGNALIGIRAVAYSSIFNPVPTKFDATLTVGCAFGPLLPAGFEEGITLAVEGGLNFTKKVSGNNLLVASPED